MSILIVCPHCGHQAEAADEYAGQCGPCAACGRTVTVPTAESAGQPRGTRSSTGLAIAVVVAALVVLAVAIAVAAVMAVPSVQRVRQSAQHAASSANLQQIGQALLAYHEQYGAFPPAYTADGAGRPLHSWRVLLLPFLGEDQLYRRIDLTQPWDSPRNQIVHAQIPPVFVAPGVAATGQLTTSYLAVVGPRTLFTGSQAVRLNEVTDGPHVTIAVVEVAGSRVHWMEPLDLDAAAIDPTVGGALGNSISSAAGGGAGVVTADGEPHFLTVDTPSETVQALLTRDAGESVTLDE